ncbi:MAG: hypothetical protein ACTSV7_04880 [Candidatus Baldrarchaeia archaeon]
MKFSEKIDKIKTYPLKERRNKVKVSDFAKICKAKSTFKEFIESLPDILAGRCFKELVDSMISAQISRKPIIWAMGAHVIKCGLSPIIINLMKQGFVNAVALNGAGVIHDVEIATIGATSEDVSEGLLTGRFGMAKETAEIINNAVKDGVRHELGFGEAVGRKLMETKATFNSYSILVNALMLKIPVTCHVAIGTDIIHMHPNADGSAIGQASLKDFKILSSIICNLGNGGVFLNIGSAVILPEVFLKALTLVRNLGYDVKNFTTAVFDFNLHYRPSQNVVNRPKVLGARGFYFIGHHELLIPLLAQAILARH